MAPAKGRAGNADHVDPLQHQLVQMLNMTGRVPGDALDQVGHAKTAPILNSIMQMGYQNAKSDPFTWAGAMSDQDAVSQAIRASREGYSLNQGDPGFFNRDSAQFKPGTASGNILHSLMQQNMKQGMSKSESRDYIQNELTKENMLLQSSMSGKSSLDPQTQQALAQRQMQNAGQAGQSGPPGSAGKVGPGASAAWAQPSYGSFDPSQLSQDKTVTDYTNQGLNSIAQYNQTAQLMGGIVPEQLRPLYDLAVNQRTQEMQNNLDLMRNQMQAAPMIQQIANTARDYRTAQKAGSGSTFQGLLQQANGGQATGGQAGQSSGSQAGLSGATGAYGGGTQGIDGQALAQQLTDQMALGKIYGQKFTGFNKPVIGSSQMTYLSDFMPRSKAGARQVGPVSQYLGAQAYPQGSQGYGGVSPYGMPQGPYGQQYYGTPYG